MQILEFLQQLFSSGGWPARWVCGQWTTFHGWLYILSSIAIWLAYFAIPVLLFLFIRKQKQSLPFGKTFWLFIAFIFACGLTHLADSTMFWYPAYRVTALLLFITAIISWVTVVNLLRILPKLMVLKTPAQVEAIVQQRFEDFVYATSHDLKSPINNIEGLVSILKWNLQKGETNNEYLLDGLEKCTTRLRTGIQGLTEVVKLESFHANPETILFSDIIAQVQEENENLFQERQAQIITNLEVEAIHYSPLALKSILYNLIINAVKYASPERQPIIKISTALVDKKQLKLVIEDNGLGIDLVRNQNKLFKLFKRLHSHVEGTGIGLYMVKKLVEDNGGSIEVTSTPGVGTTFNVLINKPFCNIEPIRYGTIRCLRNV